MERAPSVAVEQLEREHKHMRLALEVIAQQASESMSVMIGKSIPQPLAVGAVMLLQGLALAGLEGVTHAAD